MTSWRGESVANVGVALLQRAKAEHFELSLLPWEHKRWVSF